MKKILALLLSLITIFSCLGMIGAAAKQANAIAPVQIWFGGDDVESKDSVKAVSWYLGEDGKYYFFVPSYWKASEIKLWANGPEKVYLGEEEITEGGTFDLGSNGTIKCGNKTYDYVVLESAKVGSIFIETESGNLDAVHADKEYKEAGQIAIYSKKGEKQYEGDLDYIKGRGNASWRADKKPYNIKIGSKEKLFGMGKSKKWCLINNDRDFSLARNAMVYGAAADAGLAYSPEYAPVDLYINGEYKGSYLLTSKIEADSKRIDVENLDDVNEDICVAKYGEDFDMDTLTRGGVYGSWSGYMKNTIKYVDIPESEDNTTAGGYILEMEIGERYPGEISGFVTTTGQPITMKSPEYASKAQMEYISDYYQKFEDAVFSDTDKNADGKAYYDLADMESLAKYYLVSEWCSNLDSGTTSTYFYLDSSKADIKLYAGPVWDYDIAFGNNDFFRYGCKYSDPEQYTVCFARQYKNNIFKEDYNPVKTLYNKLNDKTGFVQACKQYWDEDVYSAVLSWNVEKLDSYIKNIRNSAIMNHVRWNTFGTYDLEKVAEAYDKETTSLKIFVTKRTAFINDTIGTVQVQKNPENPKRNNFRMFLNDTFLKLLKLFHLENKRVKSAEYHA